MKKNGSILQILGLIALACGVLLSLHNISGWYKDPCRKIMLDWVTHSDKDMPITFWYAQSFLEKFPPPDISKNEITYISKDSFDVYYVYSNGTRSSCVADVFDIRDWAKQTFYPWLAWYITALGLYLALIGFVISKTTWLGDQASSTDYAKIVSEPRPDVGYVRQFLRYQLTFRPIALIRMGTVAIFIAIFFLVTLCWPAWRVKRDNAWRMIRPLDVSQSNTYRLRFHPPPHGRDSIILTMGGPVPDGFKGYTDGQSHFIDVSNVFSNKDISISWCVFNGDKQVRAGTFKLSSMKAFVDSKNKHINFEAKQEAGFSELNHLNKYVLVVTVEPTDVSFKEFSATLAIPNEKRGKMVGAHPGIWPGFLAILFVGATLFGIGMVARSER